MAENVEHHSCNKFTALATGKAGHCVLGTQSWVELQENNWKLDYKIGIKKPYVKSAVGCSVWWCPLKFKVGKDLMLGMGWGVCIEVTRAVAPTEARAARFLTGFPPKALPSVFLNCRKRVLKSYFILRARPRFSHYPVATFQGSLTAVSKSLFIYNIY